MYSSSNSSHRMTMKAHAAANNNRRAASARGGEEASISSSSRRRGMAMMKYGSSTKKKHSRNSNSSSSTSGRSYSMHRARQLATAAPEVEGFADFSPFGMQPSQSNPFLTSGTQPAAPALNLFDADPFAPSQQQQQQQRKPPSSLSSQAAAFTAEWPTGYDGNNNNSNNNFNNNNNDQRRRSMRTLPSNSSMQSSFPTATAAHQTTTTHQHNTRKPQQQRRNSGHHHRNNNQHNAARTPTRTATATASPMQTPEKTQHRQHHHQAAGDHSPSPSYASSSGYTSGGGGGGGGAAARRRMRSQMRTKLQRSDTDPQLLQQQQQHQMTPPHSPSYRRYHSADSMGSASSSQQQQQQAQRGIKPTDHVANYSVSNRAGSFSNRSAGSQTNTSARSVSSNSSGGGGGGDSHHQHAGTSMNMPPTPKEVSLFHADHPNSGFTFDAFGLDASQINREVSEAMHQIAGSNPDLSFFLDQDPDDTFNAKGWDSSSPNVSRSSTPDPTMGDDGFVDGFRVTKTSSFPMKTNHAKQSPTGTERSSLTSETCSSSAPPDVTGRRNQFKELARTQQANKKYRIVRPSSTSSKFNNNATGSGSRSVQQQPRAIPRMPDLDDPDQPPPGSFSQPEEQQDNREQHLNHSSRSSSPARASSDAGVPSDVGVASDSDDDDDDVQQPALDVLSQLKRDRKKQKQQQVVEVEEDQEEKKYDEPDNRVYADIEETRSLTPSVTIIRAQWQQRDTQPKQQKQQEETQVVSSDTMTSTSTAAPQRSWVTPAASSASAEASAAARTTAKSEAGGSMRVNTSEVNALMGSWRREDDAQSDVGTPSPAFARVKLRRTGFHAKQESPKDENEMGISRNRSGLYGDDADANATASASKSSELDRERQQQHHEVERDRIQDEEVVAEEVKPKLTYRERREIELARQREEEERLQQQQANDELSQPDVAATIRRRIAANKRNGVSSFDDCEETTRITPPPVLGGGGPVQPPSRRMDEKEEQQQQQQQLSDEPTRRIERQTPHANKSELVIETRSDQSPAAPKPHMAASRLTLLEQVQQLKPVETQPAELSSLQPSSSNNNNNQHRPETPEPIHDDHQSHRAHTPKATMMMLNAFLAGRDSLSSADAGSNMRGSQSGEDPHEIKGGESSSSGNNGSEEEVPKDSPSRLPALKDDPKYDRYFKMLKIGMPMDVVKHAMTRDGLDPSVMDGDHNKPAGVPLKQDPLYSKYFKMLSIGLQMEAVKHAMERDGLDSTVMDHDHDLPAQRPRQGKDEAPKEKDSHRRARLHWKPLRKVTSNSLWAKIDEDEEIGNLQIDEQEFQELFQIEKKSESAPKAAVASLFGPKRGAVRVIDAKRANNGGIILARLKMSHDDMADAVDRINENALTAEQIENIIEYLPTKAERKALEAYMLEGGQDAAEKFDCLCECEKFMVSMMTVKHAKRKVRALLFKLQFQTCLEDIHNDTVAVETACDELVNSVRLRQLLGIVLTFGNRLNTAGNGQRKAGAFTLDSLLKLNQAKAFDKKTTFLHYIVLIVQRNNELLLNFRDDIPNVFKADKIFWDQCVTDLEEVENQLENVRKIALYQARHAVAYRFRKKKHQEEDESLSDGEVSLSLEEEVEALRATPVGLFTLSAIKIVSSLRDKVEETKSKFARLLEYFGEEEGNMQPHELFNIIGTFSRDFERAKEEVFANEKRKQREERKRQAKGKAGRPPTYSPAQKTERKASNQMLKASNLQPSMFHVLKELKSRASAREATTDSGTIPPKQPAVVSRAREPTKRPLPHAPSDEYRHSEMNDSNNMHCDSPMTSLNEATGLPQSMPTVEEVVSPIQEEQPKTPPKDVANATPSRSPSKSSHRSLSSAKARHKARLKRHRGSYTNDRSSSSPTASSPTSNPGQQNPQAASSPIPQKSQSSSSSVNTSQVMRMQMYSRSPTDNNDTGAQPLSPRSTMHQRMEQQELRQANGVPS